jgi:imidazoleglycerol-phosphate dehydratase
MSRCAEAVRATKETQIKVVLNLDGQGKVSSHTGIGFMDHMVDHIGRHGLFDLEVSAVGDLHVDGHHTVEDLGIVFGQAFAEAIGNKAGIERYGNSYVPMDEALAHVALDISGRPHLTWAVDLPKAKVGDFDIELAQEFFRAFVYKAGITLHIRCLEGSNLHHILEAVFKAFGRALRDAVATNARVKGIPSTKGSL